ncbi:MAG: hypothetical protein IT452_14370 [Planctomycetia bacterium]|nr:hypothetical protein [Planctomycetia bacterium]
MPPKKSFSQSDRPIDPIYRTPEPNAPVVLYQGPMVCGSSGRQVRGTGTLTLDWLPVPGLSFTMPIVTIDVPRGNAPLFLEHRNFVVEARVTEVHFGKPGTMRGCFDGVIEVGAESPARYVLFHVTNFLDCFAEPIHVPVSSEPDAEKRAAWPGRTVLVARGWRVTLDAVEDVYEILKAVQARRGIAITHVGKIEREDGTGVTRAEAEDLLSMFRHFISFVRGAWCSPQLCVGCDSAGKPIWELWDAGQTTPGRTMPSWFSHYHPEYLPRLFDMFVSRWHDPIWADALSLATLYYVEATSAPSGIEISGAVTQSGLELLAWMWGVEHHPHFSATAFDGMTAVERMRWMVKDQCLLKTDIPPHFTDLVNLAAANNWPDGPAAVVSLRRTIEHPKRQRVVDLRRMPVTAREQAWLLGLKYLDLAFLRVLEYDSLYVNKVADSYADSTGPVPWWSPIVKSATP